AKYLALAQVEYVEGEPETYLLPLGFATGEDAERLAGQSPSPIVCQLNLRDAKQTGVLCDATGDPSFTAALLDTFLRRRRWKGEDGQLAVSQSAALRSYLAEQDAPTAASAAKMDQSNSSIIYGDKAIMKLFRRVEPGINPDLEIGRFFAERCEFTN